MLEVCCGRPGRTLCVRRQAQAPGQALSEVSPRRVPDAAQRPGRRRCRSDIARDSGGEEVMHRGQGLAPRCPEHEGAGDRGRADAAGNRDEVVAARVAAECPEARFMVVGDYEEANREHYEEVRRALEDEGVASRFVFTGFRTDVSRLMSAFDVFVLCTHFEGLPLVILEAMARGRPVIATAVDGIPEIVIEGRTGLLHPHGDAETLAARLLSLLRDEALRARVGKAGREFVKMEWSRERFAANMVGLYEDALGVGRGGAARGEAG